MLNMTTLKWGRRTPSTNSSPLERTVEMQVSNINNSNSNSNIRNNNVGLKRMRLFKEVAPV